MATTILRDFPHMRAAASMEAWDYLQDKYPIYAKALVQEVSSGSFSTADLRRFIVSLIGDWRDPLAKRIELAADFLLSQRSEAG